MSALTYVGPHADGEGGEVVVPLKYGQARLYAEAVSAAAEGAHGRPLPEHVDAADVEAAAQALAIRAGLGPWSDLAETFRDELRGDVSLVLRVIRARHSA